MKISRCCKHPKTEILSYLILGHHDHNEGWAAGHRLYQCLGVVYIEWRLSNIDTAPFLAVNNGPGADKNINMAAAELKYGLWWWTLNPRLCVCAVIARI